jgi:ABC-type phosphate transport system substrate-binding protein
MKKITQWLILFCYFSVASAGEIAVIIEHDAPIKELSQKQIRDIFLKETTFDNNGHSWIPLNLPSHYFLRATFSQTVLKKRFDELEEYWNMKYFQGINPPHVLASEEAVILFVSNTTGAIGYILSCHADERVQVVLKVSVNDNFDRYCIETKENNSSAVNK